MQKIKKNAFLSQFMNDVDVAIVGGGPSGVVAAITIAKAGYKVAILDKKQRNKIGNKSCGDALDKVAPEIMKKELGIEFPHGKELPTPLDHLTFASLSLKNKLTAHTPAFIVHRLHYGQRLLKEAEQAGAEIIANAKVRDIIVENNQIVGLKYYNENGINEIRAKIVIDASGFVGVVRKMIPDQMKNGIVYEVPPEHTVATYREIIRLEKPHDFQKEIVLLYHEKIPIPGYAWIFTDGEYQLNIGVTWPKHIPYPQNKSLKDIYHEILDPMIDPASYTVKHKGGGQIPIRPPFDSLVFNGAMLVGEAGCLVDPTTAEGHGPSLLSGYKAGKAAIKALEIGDFTVNGLWSYNKDIMTYPGSTHAMSYQALQYLKSVGPKGMAFFLKRKIVSEEDLIEIFRTREFEFTLARKIRKVLQAFPRFDYMLKLKKTIQKVEYADQLYKSYPETPDGLQKWMDIRKKTLTDDY